MLVTGSSSGFGAATCRAFADAGWRVAATSRAGAPPPGVERGEVAPFRLDVTDPTSIDTALGAAVDRFGRIDCLVNNAGAGLLSVFESTPMSTIREHFEVNFFGMVQVSRAVVPHLRAAGGGTIVNVSSGSAIRPEPFMAAYAAAKGAVENFSEAVRYELRPHGIRVRLVEPGLVTGTNFIAATTQASAAAPVGADYRAQVERAIAMYSAPTPYALATADTVADAVVRAATDPGDRLRHLVGEDVVASAHMRHETSEDEYDAWTLRLFGAL